MTSTESSEQPLGHRNRADAERKVPNMCSAIQSVALVRRFGDLTAVDGVDLDVATGEIYGFLGPNGAGKSTMMRMLCTLLAPTSGQATVPGFDVVDDPGAVRLRIGVALQDAALDPRQTGAELLRLQGLLYGCRGARRTAASASSAS
jgi:ABC-2 type transport system ATP-binding protein